MTVVRLGRLDGSGRRPVQPWYPARFEGLAGEDGGVWRDAIARAVAAAVGSSRPLTPRGVGRGSTSNDVMVRLKSAARP